VFERMGVCVCVCECFCKCVCVYVRISACVLMKWVMIFFSKKDFISCFFQTSDAKKRKFIGLAFSFDIGHHLFLSNLLGTGWEPIISWVSLFAKCSLNKDLFFIELIILSFCG